MSPSLSPHFTLSLPYLTYLIIILSLIHVTNANFDEKDKTEVKDFLEEQFRKQVANTTLDLEEAFRQATGHKLQHVVIIVVLVMTIPSLLINVAFLLCQCALKSGAKVACCCCKHGLKCGGKAICCCGRIVCGKAICPLCGKLICCCSKILCPCCHCKKEDPDSDQKPIQEDGEGDNVGGRKV